MISPLFRTDDVVRCRTATSRWNVGSRHGDMGEFHFLLLQNDPYEKFGITIRTATSVHDVEEELPVHGRVP